LFCPRGSRLRQYNWPCQPWGEGAFCRLYIPPLHIIDGVLRIEGILLHHGR
jgi:hypothetical protein